MVYGSGWLAREVNLTAAKRMDGEANNIHHVYASEVWSCAWREGEEKTPAQSLTSSHLSFSSAEWTLLLFKVTGKIKHNDHPELLGSH